MDPDTTSLTLLQQLCNDEPTAWERFMRLYSPLVFAWARNAGVRPDDVHDVGQEVFRVVSQKIQSYEHGRKAHGAFRSWLWGITRLQILDQFRKNAKQIKGRGGETAQLLLNAISEQTDEPNEIQGRSPDEIMLESASQIVQEECEPRTWQAFYRMTVLRESAGEIGDALGMDARAVRQAKFRVARKLRELLNAVDVTETGETSDSSIP